MPKPAIADPQVERRIARSEVISKVAGGVVHNFNNILSVLLGRVELMLGQVDGGRLDPTQLRKGLVSIQKAALDAAELLTRLRDLARPPQDVPFSTFDLNAAVAEAIDFIQPHLMTVAQGMGITVRLTPRLAPPPVLVSGQSSALREVLVNLILNAIEAMPEGGDVGIETRRDGPWVKLQVSDTGIGMTEEVRAQVFRPFFTTKSAGSTGLGLSSAKDLITGHGGTISVASTPGRGRRCRRASGCWWWTTSVILATSCASSSGPRAARLPSFEVAGPPSRPSSGTGSTSCSPICCCPR